MHLCIIRIRFKDAEKMNIDDDLPEYQETQEHVIPGSYVTECYFFNTLVPEIIFKY